MSSRPARFRLIGRRVLDVSRRPRSSARRRRNPGPLSFRSRGLRATWEDHDIIRRVKVPGTLPSRPRSTGGPCWPTPAERLRVDPPERRSEDVVRGPAAAKPWNAPENTLCRAAAGGQPGAGQGPAEQGDEGRQIPLGKVVAGVADPRAGDLPGGAAKVPQHAEATGLRAPNAISGASAGDAAPVSARMRFPRAAANSDLDSRRLGAVSRHCRAVGQARFRPVNIGAIRILKERPKRDCRDPAGPAAYGSGRMVGCVTCRPAG